MEKRTRGLTQTSFAVLSLVGQIGEATSYDIKLALEDSIQHFWPIPHTTAYEEPARLTAEGLLSATQEGGGRKRRLYTLTTAGRDALKTWVEEPIAAPPQLRDELWLKVFAGADPGPLITHRIELLRTRIAKLEGNLEMFSRSKDSEGAQRALRAALGFNQILFDVVEELPEHGH